MHPNSFCCCIVLLNEEVRHAEVLLSHPLNPPQPQQCWPDNLTLLEWQKNLKIPSGITKAVQYLSLTIITVVTATEISSGVFANAVFFFFFFTALFKWFTVAAACTEMCTAASVTLTESPPAGSMYFFLPWPTDKESGMDSKGCSLGRDKALVSTPWAWALLWIITPLSGVAAVGVCGCAHVRMCVCARLPACDRMSEREAETQKELLILMSFYHIRGPSIAFWDQLQSLLPPTVFSATLAAHHRPPKFKKYVL